MLRSRSVCAEFRSRSEPDWPYPQSRSQFDQYKQVYRFTFAAPKIVFRTNPDFEGPMTQRGEEVLEKLQTAP